MPDARHTVLASLRSTAFDERYYAEHKAAGLDYLGHGRWQEEYGRWLADSLGWHEQRVLDVGCACGSILQGFCSAGINAVGIDVSEYMIRLGREKWPSIASRLHVADAVNLHLFEDETFEGLHSAQVAEHWKPELVPHILRELHRVTRPGGLFFCCLDTAELFVRQGRVLEKEDPTHVCIRSLKWWYEKAKEAGWRICSEEYFPAMLSHPESFLKRYDWDWFVARAT